MKTVNLVVLFVLTVLCQARYLLIKTNPGEVPEDGTDYSEYSEYSEYQEYSEYSGYTDSNVYSEYSEYKEYSDNSEYFGNENCYFIWLC